MRHFVLILFFLQTAACIGQFVPAKFVVKVSDLAESFELLSNIYEFGTNFKHVGKSFQEEGSAFAKQTLEMSSDSETVLLFLGSSTLAIGEIYQLTIRNTIENSEMNIYVRLSDAIIEGTTLKILNLEFKAGNFLFDGCSKRKKHSSKIIKLSLEETIFDLSSKKAISNNKLIRILKRNSCN